MKRVCHGQKQLHTQSDGSETNYDLHGFHEANQKPVYVALIRETLPDRRDAVLQTVAGILQRTYLCEPDQVRLYGGRPDGNWEQVNLSRVPTRSVGAGMLATQEDQPIPWGAGSQAFYSKTPLDPQAQANVLQEVGDAALSDAARTPAQREVDAVTRELRSGQVPPSHRPVSPDPVAPTDPVPRLDPPLPSFD